MISNMIIEKAIPEILFRLIEKKEVFIKMIAINRKNGNLVFTTYGSVSEVTRDRIFFSYKRMSQGQGGLTNDSKKDYEYYIKPEFAYDITFIEDFNEEDFYSLIDLTLQETFQYSIYNAFKSFLGKLKSKKILKFAN